MERRLGGMEKRLEEMERRLEALKRLGGNEKEAAGTQSLVRILEIKKKKEKKNTL